MGYFDEYNEERRKYRQNKLNRNKLNKSNIWIDFLRKKKNITVDKINKKTTLKFNNFIIYFNLFVKKIFFKFILKGKKTKIINIYVRFVKHIRSLFLKKYNYNKKLKLKHNKKLKLKHNKKLKLKYKFSYVYNKKLKKFEFKIKYKYKLKSKSKNKINFFLFHRLYLYKIYKNINIKVSYINVYSKGKANFVPNLNKFKHLHKKKIINIVSTWIKNSINIRKEKTLKSRIISELIDIYNNKGNSIKQKLDFYKNIYSNKKYYKYKSWI